jgi:hypothetical protein
MGEEVSGQSRVVEFSGKRIRYNSPLSFDEVLAKLQARVGETNIGDLLDSSATREEFEKKVQQSAGDSGLMLMVRIDHGRWLERWEFRVCSGTATIGEGGMRQFRGCKTMNFIGAF